MSTKDRSTRLKAQGPDPKIQSSRFKPDAGLIALLATVAGFAVLQGLMSARVVNLYWQQIATMAGVMTISALGLNLVYGFAGQFSLGHAAFFGIGAYSSALITRSLGGSIWTLQLGMLVGAVLAAAVALVIGLPILRLKSDYLGIATLGFGIIMKVLFDNSNVAIPMLGGSAGMSGIPRLTSFPLVFVTMLAAIVVLRNLVYSSPGRALISVREDELASEAVGVNTTKYKTMGFVVGCVYAGVAGALYAHLYAYLNPANFDFLKSIDVLLIVVLGGLGSISGTILAAVAWTFLLEGLRVILPAVVQEWRMVIYPLVLIAFMLVRPGGVFKGTEFRFLRPKEHSR